MEIKFLEDAGLTQKEIDIYLILLNLKSAPISEIISKAKMAKQTIYEIMQKLLEKGLISYTIKGGKKLYTLANPERLLDIIKEKEDNIRALLPELMAKYGETKEDIKAEVFIGKEGLKTLLNDILRVRKPLYVLSNDAKIFEVLQYYMPQYMKKQAELGIHLRVIYSERMREKKLHWNLVEIRYVPEEYRMPVSIAIYGDYCYISVYSENPVAIHIKSKEIAESYMQYFNLMWSLAKK